jgi:hypothetical protein
MSVRHKQLKRTMPQASSITVNQIMNQSGKVMI